MRAPERAETTLPTLTAADLDGLAQNDVLYLSFLPLCDPSYLVGIPDGGGILTKVIKGAGRSVQFHYIGRAAGGAYPYIIDKYGVPTGETLNMNDTLSTIYSQQVTDMFTSLGYTATLASDDHVSTNASTKYVVHGVIPTDIGDEELLAVAHDFGGGLVNPIIYVGSVDVINNAVCYICATESSPYVAWIYENGRPVRSNVAYADLVDYEAPIAQWLESLYPGWTFSVEGTADYMDISTIDHVVVSR